MSKEFDKIISNAIGKTIAKKPIVVEEPITAKVVVENIVPIIKKREKLTLIAPLTPMQDPKALTIENIQELGFQKALIEEFIGATDKTFFTDIPNSTGRATLVYDFLPQGNHGKPAAHVYYSANDSQISESLVCFTAPTTMGEMRQLMEAAKNLNPTESKSLHNIESVKALILEVKNSMASDKIVEVVK